MNLIHLPIIVCVCKNPIKDNIYIITNKVFIIIIKIPRQTALFKISIKIEHIHNN